MLGVYFKNSKFKNKFPKIDNKSRLRKRNIHLSGATGKFYMINKRKNKPIQSKYQKLSKTVNYAFLKNTV